MNIRYSIWLAWSLWMLTVVLSVLTPLIDTQEDTLIIILPLVAWTCTSVTVGTIIVSRRPGNRVGWILSVIGFLWASNTFFGLYAIRALVTYPGSLPLGEVAAWIGSWLANPAFQLLAYLFLLFPDGRLLSSRWRSLLWLNGFAIAAIIVVEAFTPGPIAGLEGIRNPLGIQGYGASLDFLDRLLSFIGDALVLISVGSVFLRLRSANEVTRQQIKWLAYAAALLGVVIIVGAVGDLTFGGFGWWLFLVVIVAFLGLPLSIGVAILRYRLYDIDRIINLTLVYGSLTGFLILVYICCVVGLQYALRFLTGDESQIVIVAATLMVAALFNPLRRRIQAFIDRRFYRRKYDAAKILEEFSVKLRGGMDPGDLSENLIGVLSEAMQPEHVSVWLRRPERRPQ